MNKANNSLEAYPQFTAPNAAADDEIDLRELFLALWKGKWLIIVITAIFAIGSVLFALSKPNIYKADALLAPVEASSGGRLSRLTSQFGGLAALSGINLGGGDSNQTTLAIQVVKSRQFIEEFVAKHNLLVPIMAAKGWDMQSNELIINQEIYDSETDTWLREPDGLRGAVPSAQEVYEVFSKEILSTSQDKDSGLYTISVMHYSPFMAQQWVMLLVEDLNQVMRERAVAEATTNLEYLNLQLNKTSVAGMQSLFYNLIEEQTKTLMMAQVQAEFIFKVVDPAVVPEVKSKPKRALICALGTLLGGMFGVAIVLVRFAFRKEPIPQQLLELNEV
ncbi:LPS O-antigen length regulator [Vibrio sp. JPW-9-11-11]|uniref:Wzz/FepE/Etk N-terminal domain-containing protein n=1 Tax=Vibrio sp. JPW-9-11-11 TaxID=1416532 RepID=UPI001593E325|nr:Wzz/FepE/Etk N-terminal domain-containing protein [Vibrio sp. JPW-9-11-11]NVD05414.1 LPS O-antigen length regulator [Vibrio sp. JPW-9-11-11]